jgi:anti-sigma factor RsiW
MAGTCTDTLGAHLDGELDPDAAARIEDLLERDPAARADYEALAGQSRLIGAAAAALETGPANLRTAALERQLAAKLAQRAAPRRWNTLPAWTRQAAAALALVAFGWWGHAWLAPTRPGLPAYVSEAVGAHAVFAEDSLHPAEFSGQALSGASDWFSRKIGTSIAIPDLRGAGMQLVGARLLGTREGPIAQVIYEDSGGHRLSLALARHPVDEPQHGVEIVANPQNRIGFWSGAHVDYALVGDASADDLRQIATLILTEG